MSQHIAKAMKEGMRRLAAGVSVVALNGDDGKPCAMTVTSVTSVSDAPPSLLVCINQSARLHEHLAPAKRFALHVLSDAQQAVSMACSSGDPAESRFKVGNWTLHDDQPPMLNDAQASFVCHIRGLYPYGTHTIVVGDIEAVHVLPGTPAPLLYLNGNYARVQH